MSGKFTKAERVALAVAVCSYVAKADWDGDCLIRLEITGYGDIKFAGRRTSASRAVYMNAHGPLPASLHVRHKCDRAGCVNIDHLEPGTPSQNNRDKRRSAGHGQYGQVGEAHRSAALTADLVATLRRRAKAGISIRDLTDELGGVVGFNAIRRAVRGMTWRSVSEAPAPAHHTWSTPSPLRRPVADRAKALSLAEQGMTLSEIAARIGCSRDTAFLLTQDEVA